MGSGNFVRRIDGSDAVYVSIERASQQSRWEPSWRIGI
jgi:hypothetical protein